MSTQLRSSLPRKAGGIRPRPHRAAFSLLELMIALGLLGALLAVAWSLLGTFRDAEVRGWRLSHRVQVIRSARAWLEWDLQHVILTADVMGLPPTPSPTNTASLNKPRLSNSHRFIGTATGFSATIAPSIDPIPFLENLMSESMQSDREIIGPDSMLSGDDADGEWGDRQLWPAETIDIEYQLMPMESISGKSMSMRSSTSDLDDTQFVFVRREKVDMKSETSFSNPSERVLTAQDLYRQSDDGILDPNASFRESRLEGLTKVQFRYFDGSSWKSNWNSDSQGGLPKAVALGFDFPAASEMRPTTGDRSNNENREELSYNPRMELDLPLGDASLSTEPIAEISKGTDQSIMESSTSEVQIVVLLGKVVPANKSTATSIISRGRR